MAFKSDGQPLFLKRLITERSLTESKLRKRKIGQLDVSAVGIGCYNFGRLLDLEQTRTAIYSAIDHGINFVDTSDSYGNPPTNCQTVIGEALQSRRNEIILATKFGRALGDQPGGANAASGCSPSPHARQGFRISAVARSGP